MSEPAQEQPDLKVVELPNRWPCWQFSNSGVHLTVYINHDIGALTVERINWVLDRAKEEVVRIANAAKKDNPA